MPLKESQVQGLTPREIVAELDRHIVGQADAKKMVAIALRNRNRRKLAPESLREEISPKNIIMIGPTGVGKTEIARRLSRMAQSPFLKVEVTKYTEVGYVGRDVESMVRDLMEIGLNLVKAEKAEEVGPKARGRAEERLLDMLLPPPSSRKEAGFGVVDSSAPDDEEEEADDHSIEVVGDELTPQQRYRRSRAKMRRKLSSGEMDEKEVEIEVDTGGSGPGVNGIIGIGGMEEMSMGLKDMMERMMPKQRKRRKMPISQARDALYQEETEKLLDMDAIVAEARERVEQSGIIFLDEFDKIAGRGGGGHGPDVSREGVQRDILPIVEGSTVATKYGMVRTDHVLFIAAGAFHMRKPSDLIPELQGRFPLRVELKPLTMKDLMRILTEPKGSLTKQYTALMATEAVELSFTDDGVEEIAISAQRANEQGENIGARRLHTIVERILEDVSFDANERAGQKVVIDREFVKERLKGILEDEDLSRYIL